MLCLSLLTPTKQEFKAKYVAFLLNNCQVRDCQNTKCPQDKVSGTYCEGIMHSY